MISKRLNEQIAELKKYKGQNVSVTYFSLGEIYKEEGRLESDGWTDGCVDLTQGENDKNHIPVLKKACAIQRITHENGNVLYENPLINKSFPKNFEKIRKKCGFD